MVVAYSGAAPNAGATMTVLLSGTPTPATIYADDLLTPLANPFTADLLTGAYLFYADDALAYDVQAAVPSTPDLVENPGDPFVVAGGVTPNRVISLVVNDNGTQIVLAQVVY
jgi:hypothetical protein